MAGASSTSPARRTRRCDSVPTVTSRRWRCLRSRSPPPACRTRTFSRSTSWRRPAMTPMPITTTTSSSPSPAAGSTCCSDDRSPMGEATVDIRYGGWTRGLVAALLTASLMPLNSTMVAVAVPAIGRQFDQSPERVTQALVATYLIAAIALQSPGGKLGDRLGHWRGVGAGGGGGGGGGG